VLLVALVMLILTIKFRRAGPSLRLHAAVFGEELSQLVHNAEDDSPWLASLDEADEMQLVPFHVGLADSQQASNPEPHTSPNPNPHPKATPAPNFIPSPNPDPSPSHHQVSEYLLESFNEHSRPPRFGALVLNDTLRVRLLARVRVRG
jgi:hypothetical protein